MSCQNNTKFAENHWLQSTGVSNQDAKDIFGNSELVYKRIEDGYYKSAPIPQRLSDRISKVNRQMEVILFVHHGLIEELQTVYTLLGDNPGDKELVDAKKIIEKKEQDVNDKFLALTNKKVRLLIEKNTLRVPSSKDFITDVLLASKTILYPNRNALTKFIKENFLSNEEMKKWTEFDDAFVLDDSNPSYPRLYLNLAVNLFKNLPKTFNTEKISDEDIYRFQEQLNNEMYNEVEIIKDLSRRVNLLGQDKETRSKQLTTKLSALQDEEDTFEKRQSIIEKYLSPSNDNQAKNNFEKKTKELNRDIRQLNSEIHAIEIQIDTFLNGIQERKIVYKQKQEQIIRDCFKSIKSPEFYEKISNLSDYFVRQQGFGERDVYYAHKIEKMKDLLDILTVQHE